MTGCAGRIWGCRMFYRRVMHGQDLVAGRSHSRHRPRHARWPATTVRGAAARVWRRLPRALADPRGAAGGQHWREAAYRTYSPWVFTFPHATVHSTAGIVCLGGRGHRGDAGPCRPGPARLHPGAAGSGSSPARRHVAGHGRSPPWRGSADNYYHTPARRARAACPSSRRRCWTGADGLLTTSRSSARWRGCRTGLCRRWGLADGTVAERTEPAGRAAGARQRPDHAPATTTPACLPGSTRRPWPRRLAMPTRDLHRPAWLGSAAPAQRSRADRGAGCDRHPGNRAGAAGAPRSRSPLFRNARLIVAPHGSGLANLVFAQTGLPGDRAADGRLLQLVLPPPGRLEGASLRLRPRPGSRPWLDASGPVHACVWHVSVPHVVAAVRSVLHGPVTVARWHDGSPCRHWRMVMPDPGRSLDHEPPDPPRPGRRRHPARRRH